MQKNTLTWLHLSDLHYCEPRTGWEANTVLGTLLEDLEKMEKRLETPPDLIFFTGDLAFGSTEDGLESQYEGVGGFLETIRKAFSKEVPKDYMFLVPGNHDVNRKVVTDMETMWLDGTSDEDEITKMIHEAGLKWEICFRRMIPYRTFLEANGYNHLLKDDPGRLVYAVEREIRGKTIGIGGFNSAWACCRPSAEEKSQLWMAGKWQFETILSKIKNSDVKIALAHHPDGWFKESEKQYFIKIQEAYQFFLHGHEHSEWVTQISDYHATVSAGACHARSDMGYNLVRLNFDEDIVEIWPREYSGKGEGGWIRATIPRKLDEDGAWRIRDFQWEKGKNNKTNKTNKEKPRKKGQVVKIRPDARLRRAWLNQVMEETGFVPLAGADSSLTVDSDMTGVVPDNSIYTVLLTLSTDTEEQWIEKHIKPEEEKRLSALEMLNRYNRLVLLGEPGSGKSTFMNFVAWCLAGENLGHPFANLDLLKQPLPAEKQGDKNPPQSWDHLPLIPVRIIFRDLIISGALEKEETQEELALWRFIEFMLKEKGLGEYVLDLKAELMETGGMILLDGLEEVPAAGHSRKLVKQALESFAANFHRCRYLVTSRNYAYQKQSWHLDRFHVTELSPFNQSQVRHFIDLWYRRVSQKKGMSANIASIQSELLQREISKKDRLRELAKRPLLLTLMAFLHTWHIGPLPEKREELYSETVELLLSLWEKGKRITSRDGKSRIQQPSLIEYLNSERKELLGLLERLAFDAHRRLENLHFITGIPEDNILAGLLKLGLNAGVKYQELVNYMSDRAGILVVRQGLNVFTFPHRILQEYLAACYQTGADFPDEIVRLFKTNPDHWREVVLLAGEKQARGGQIGLWALVEALCLLEYRPDSDVCNLSGAHIAGQILLESVDLTCISPKYKPKLECLRNSLVHIIEGDRLPAQERAEAGVTLAKIGDPRAEVMTLNAMQFCLVPAGVFIMDENDGEEICPVLDELYWIGRFPVTNAQFDCFVQDGGYSNEDYWGEAIREGVWKAGEIKGYWNKTYRDKLGNYGGHFFLPNHPVAGVMWYEAIAFTRWLNEIWRANGVLSKKFYVALPSEVEWEKAARGGINIPVTTIIRHVTEIPEILPELKLKANRIKTRRYPYGEQYSTERMNCKSTGINSTSSIECFSIGKSPYGCEEMCGNVWEWTRSIYKGYPYKPDDGREDEGKIRNSTGMVLRGGSFYSDDTKSRCGFRGRSLPFNWYWDYGFRLLLRPDFLTSDARSEASPVEKRSVADQNCQMGKDFHNAEK